MIKVRIIIKFILLLCCMILIFSFSSDSGTRSTKKSDQVILSVLKVFDKDSLSEKKQKETINQYVFFVRKSAHFLIYFLLGLLTVSLLSEKKDFHYYLICSMLFCFLYALSDEIHQAFVPGRSGNIYDVFLDSFASFLAITLYYLLFIYKKRGEISR